ncbi:hypothetical protein [Actinomadura rupiterrae]|uniref:hypothetical protein n=1 Tax=Actinomadura rupiterrae TaxID=559627 RepID=UPI0020A54F38|nr:hypothetical protein [Actinomadura rupiterrae]MCP2335638.1 hypothetical protein [Actinomadura rupiterrae]
MPKPPHEALHRIFRCDGGLFARALKSYAGIDFPEIREVQEVDTILEESKSTVGEVDTALLVTTVESERHVAIVEAQGKIDPDKLLSWPYYLGYLQYKHKCDATLMVVSHDLETIRWARRPIKKGLPGWTSLAAYPIGFGPDNVEPLTSPDQFVHDPMAAAFSILTHAATPPAKGIMGLMDEGIDALLETDEKTARFLGRFLHAGLAKSDLLEPWREIVSTIIYDKKLFHEISAKSEAKAGQRMLLTVLEARGLRPSESERRRILDCRDSAVLELWGARAVSAESMSDVFAD